MAARQTMPPHTEQTVHATPGRADSPYQTRPSRHTLPCPANPSRQSIPRQTSPSRQSEPHPSIPIHAAINKRPRSGGGTPGPYGTEMPMGRHLQRYHTWRPFATPNLALNKCSEQLEQPFTNTEQNKGVSIDPCCSSCSKLVLFPRGYERP